MSGLRLFFSLRIAIAAMFKYVLCGGGHMNDVMADAHVGKNAVEHSALGLNDRLSVEPLHTH